MTRRLMEVDDLVRAKVRREKVSVLGLD
jgi:hypothetical protein